MIMAPLADVSSRANHTDSWRVQKPVIDYSKCIRCMICWKFCPDACIDVVDGGNYVAPSERTLKLEAPSIDMNYCKGCGICANECPEKCIEMILEEKEES
jgi:2-oxoacid:acceptor oxidoreductase delta subunit (pyruvate/2-ketoisovalerate family)